MELSTIDHLPSEVTSTVTGGGLRHLLDTTDGRESVRSTWRLEAACRDVETAIFFAERHNNGLIRQAKKVCATCPVIAECLEYAVAGPGEGWGVWGGTTVRDRRRIRRERRAQQKEAAA